MALHSASRPRRPEAAAGVGRHAVSCSVSAAPAAAAPAPQHAGDGAGAADGETDAADAEGPSTAREFFGDHDDCQLWTYLVDDK